MKLPVEVQVRSRKPNCFCCHLYFFIFFSVFLVDKTRKYPILFFAFDRFMLIFYLLLLVAAWSPTDSYAPGEVECPSDLQLVRTANSILQEEEDYITERNKKTDEALKTYLKNANMIDFDVDSFFEDANESIKIGLSFSGGGYRAMLVGAGQLAALDSRTDNATESGLGGLLQASSYLVGLSGGNWLVGSVVLNNWTSVQDIVNKNEIWDLTNSIANYGGLNVFKTVSFYNGISNDLDAKRDAGFDVSFTDTWARALSHQFFTTLEDTGASMTWSGMTEFDAFKDHDMPFPIVVAVGRTPGTFVLSGNSTVFEFTPYELGSWDPSVYQFTNIKYLGTTTDDGVASNGTCWGGFDNAGFVMGTSSSLFNQFILQINSSSVSSTITSIVLTILGKVSAAENDVAVYKPNPFANTSDVAGSESIVKNDTLYLVDGGLDNQNVPLYPLLQRERKVDAIFAFDNSADTNQNWPNGSSLVYSYQRQFLPQGNNTIFPYVPDVNSFRNLNLTSRPTFFGCDARNLSSLMNEDAPSDYSVFDSPLIIYTANRPFSYFSNVTTFTLSYSNEERNSIIRNGYETASRLNNTLDDEWQACVGCAIIRRYQERNEIEQTEQCQRCFERYCWNGDLDTKTPELNFTQTGTTNETDSSGKKSAANSFNKYSIVKSVAYGLLSVLVFVSIN